MEGADKPDDEKAEGAVEEEEFQDAKEMGFVASKISKTQEIAEQQQILFPSP